MMMGFSRFMSCCILAITITNVVSFQRSLNGMRHRGRQSLNVAMNAEHSGLAMTDKVSITKFHHVEFYCGDATNTYKRFLVGLGMELISKSDQSTGNCVHASYVLKSGDMQMVFTAPYSSTMGTSPTTPSATATATAPAVSANLDNIVGPFPSFHPEVASDFFKKHGFGVKSVAVEVSDVTTSYDAMMMSGGISYLKPTKVTDKNTANGFVEYAELVLYGDVIIRLLNTQHFKGKFLPNFDDVKAAEGRKKFDFGIKKFDHIVGNLWTLQPTMDKIKKMTGFHDFAEFAAAVVGTVDSGLNSVVLANENEMVLLPINEPTYGTKRKSQIQTYLEQNNGEGVQHMALFTSDIFSTLRQMREASHYGGFEFMDRQPESYYDNLPLRLGESLSAEQYSKVRELGILADKDDQGVLLQIFTKPVGDRPTLFLEIIQRLGCLQSDGEQRPGCGGFGKGNFKDLFKSIEDYEKTLAI